MRIITRQRISRWVQQHPKAAASLVAWQAVARRAVWHHLMDVRRDFPHADGVTVASGRVLTIFNIAGNAYRLLTAIHFNTGRVYVRQLLTHAEYDRQTWFDTE